VLTAIRMIRRTAIVPMFTSMFCTLHSTRGGICFPVDLRDNVEDYIGIPVLVFISPAEWPRARRIFAEQRRGSYVGASGAIAGVMGAYFVYIAARVLIWFRDIFLSCSGLVMLGYWFVGTSERRCDGDCRTSQTRADAFWRM